MRKLILAILLLFTLPVFSKTADTKTYPIKPEDAFMLSLDTISQLNFSVSEMQANSGYILFQTPSKTEYLILISENGENNSDIKISKVKPTSFLREIQDLFYTTFESKMTNHPIRIDK